MDFRKANLEKFQKKYGLKLGFMSAFVKAAAYALQDQPVVNAVIDPTGTEIIYRDYVDISVAVATPKVIFKIFFITFNLYTCAVQRQIICFRDWWFQCLGMLKV